MSELQLLDSVLLKLGLAKDDAQLEAFVKIYLCPVLLKTGELKLANTLCSTFMTYFVHFQKDMQSLCSSRASTCTCQPAPHPLATCFVVQLVLLVVLMTLAAASTFCLV